MKYKFLLDQQKVVSKVPENATFQSDTVIKINRKNLTVSLSQGTDAELEAVFINNTLYHIEFEMDSQGYPLGIYINGEYFPAALSKIDRLFYYKDKEIRTAGSGTVKSFLPGYIKKVFYTVNDRVQEDDIILIHEAMKMENEIKAPKSGVITKIGVNEGDTVSANHILFEIE